MGKLLVHVGLPKTATTSLQRDWFPSLARIAGVRYLGIRQPREQAQDPTYTACMSAIWNPEAAGSARSALEEALSESSLVIWSEEMLTVGNRERHWLVNLDRLARLVEGLDYIVLCGVRNPAEASFSYFVEIHPYFRESAMGYEQAVREDEVMAIYRYARLIAALEERFVGNRLLFKRFEDIAAGRLGDVLGRLGLDGDAQAQVPLPVRNAKLKKEGRVFTGKDVSLADVLRGGVVRLGLRRLAFWDALRSGLRPLISGMDRWSLTERKIAVPSAEVMARVDDFYARDWAVMQERMRP